MGRRSPGPGLNLRLSRLWPAALLLAITACSPAVQTPQAAPSAPPPAEQLAGSFAAQDASGFADAFADSTLARAQAERWFGLLTVAEAELTVLGPQELQVRTQLPGDRRPATQRIKLVRSGDGTGISVVAEPDTPLWALEPATLTTGGAGSVLAAADAEQAESWLELMARATTAVRAAAVVPEGSWSGRLVVELPSSADDFALLTGATADTSSAVTSCRSGTPRIVVNPRLSSYAQSVQFATLTHEAVHAATDSACEQGLSWAVEGLAESVAAQADPGTAQANRRLVLAYLEQHPVPSALPENPRTPTDYALAQVAADQVRKRLGEQAPAYFARATRSQLGADEISRATTWYQRALRELRD